MVGRRHRHRHAMGRASRALGQIGAGLIAGSVAGSWAVAWLTEAHRMAVLEILVTP